MICTRKSVILRVLFPLPIGGPTLLLYNLTCENVSKKVLRVRLEEEEELEAATSSALFPVSAL